MLHWTGKDRVDNLMWRWPAFQRDEARSGEGRQTEQAKRHQAGSLREVLTFSSAGGRIVARVRPKGAGSQLLLNMATLLRPVPSCLSLPRYLAIPCRTPPHVLRFGACFAPVSKQKTRVRDYLDHSRYQSSTLTCCPCSATFQYHCWYRNLERLRSSWLTGIPADQK